MAETYPSFDSLLRFDNKSSLFKSGKVSPTAPKSLTALVRFFRIFEYFLGGGGVLDRSPTNHATVYDIKNICIPDPDLITAKD